MADQKTERLINLTLALLAAKRFLKKSEIFRVVEGYSGPADSMDRMFERDKSDLRMIGIEISVGDIDPLFDDEPGYRIFDTDYSIELPNLSTEEFAILNSAVHLWRNSGSFVKSDSIRRKLGGVESNSNDFQDARVQYRPEGRDREVDLIRGAIRERQAVGFKYGDGGAREINPYRLILWNGYWYVAGFDLNKEAIRVFRLNRIDGEVRVKNSGSFEIPIDFDIRNYLPKTLENSQIVRIRIKLDQAYLLREGATFIHEDGIWEYFDLPYDSKKSLFARILWHGSSVELIEPLELREELISKLKKVSNG